MNGLLLVRAGGVCDMRFCGHEGAASWEECRPEIFAGKGTQKYNNDDREGWWHMNWLNW